jgi:Protein of unknown function (DUF998)
VLYGGTVVDEPGSPGGLAGEAPAARWRVRAAAGVVGPVAFTAAWVASTLRQEGYAVASEQLSGLAAPDARDPWVMTSGFLTLGVSVVLFASALEEALGGRRRAGPGPALVRLAGLGALAAGVLRRDRMLLHPPDGPPGPQSWMNDGHDLASLAVYAALVAAPLVLARRFAAEAAWRPLAVPTLATGVANLVLLGLFTAKVIEPWNGVVQRVAVTIPLAWTVVMATRLLRR